MNTSLIKKAFLILLLAASSQFVLAQTNNSSKQFAHPTHYATPYHSRAIQSNGDKVVIYKVEKNPISEDVLKMYPEAVKFEKRFYPVGKNSFKIKTVRVIDQEKLNAALAISVKDQQAEIQRLRKEIAK
jgi:hypothetical protein